MSYFQTKFLRAKLHGIFVTDSNLNYHGSITLDPEQCRLAGIYPLEFVEIWNKNNGSRISTYVILGEPNSRCCVLNGSAARSCQQGDELIIAAFHYAKQVDTMGFNPKVLMFNHKNEISKVMEYVVSSDNKGYCNFVAQDVSY